MNVEQPHHTLPLKGTERTLGQHSVHCSVARTYPMEMELSKLIRSNNPSRSTWCARDTGLKVGLHSLIVIGTTASLSSKMKSLAENELCGMLLERGQPHQVTCDQWNEIMNDVCHLGAEGIPWHRDAMSLNTLPHLQCSVPSSLRPASKDIVSDSELL